MAKRAFDPGMVTDAKRLVRGEHYLLASRLVRSRSADRSRIRVLMVPGRAAQEEVSAIRAAMPGAHITAVDRDTAALEAAIEAGADDVVEADLGGVERRSWNDPALSRHSFDIVNIDLCCGATTQMRDILRAATSATSNRGVVMGWFSYGRDVVEFYVAKERGHILNEARVNSVPEAMRGRIGYLTDSRLSVVSALSYRGNQMPMCSVLWQRQKWGVRVGWTLLWVEDADLRRACLFGKGDGVDPACLYATPATRIAAWRAVATRESVRHEAAE